MKQFAGAVRKRKMQWVDLGQLTDAHPAALCLPPQQDDGRKRKIQSSWVETKTGRFLTSYHHRQDRLHGLQGNACSTTVSPQAAGQSLLGARGAALPPPPLASLFPGLFLTLSPSLPAVFAPSDALSQRPSRPHRWAQLGPVAGWNRPWWAPGSPSLPSQRPPLQPPLPAPGGLCLLRKVCGENETNVKIF